MWVSIAEKIFSIRVHCMVILLCSKKSEQTTGNGLQCVGHYMCEVNYDVEAIDLACK